MSSVTDQKGGPQSFHNSAEVPDRTFKTEPLTKGEKHKLKSSELSLDSTRTKARGG